MNNIKALRIEKALTQPELVRLISLPYFDVPMLSRIENDFCRPTPEVERRLCNVLHAAPVELYGEWRQIELNITCPKPEPELDTEVLELMSYLPRRKENAIPRFLLRMNMDCSDRHLRRIIEKANRSGVFVGNGSDGRGYFLIDTVEEGIRYYHQERARAVSKFTALAPLRAWLRANGADI